MSEKWHDVPGYEGVYQISNNGMVRNSRRGRLLQLHRLTNGYRQVVLYKRGARSYALVHRLVAEAFLPNPEYKPQVNHIDGNKSNNTASNLEWCTLSENLIHRHRVLGQIGGRAKAVIHLNTGKEYASARIAARCLNLSAPNITRVCRKEQKTTKKQKFIYKEIKNYGN